jgi:hypothetical protein
MGLLRVGEHDAYAEKQVEKMAEDYGRPTFDNVFFRYVERGGRFWSPIKSAQSEDEAYQLINKQNGTNPIIK